MKANSKLVLTGFEKDQKEDLLKLFELEDKSFSSERAKYNIEESNDELIFVVEAEDLVALRACMTAITKTLSIYERTSNLVKS